MKNSSKTSKRRLKKSVRRTVGGLCLASAIMVAAIPFPEAEAYNPVVESIPAYDVGVSDYIYDYPDLDYPTNTDFTTMSGTVKRATVLAKNNSNQYSLDWQFEYWLGTGGGNGYITDYNDQYQMDTVTLESRVYSDYVYISQADMKKFNDDTNKYVDVTINKATPETITNKVRSLSYQYIIDDAFDSTNDDHLWLQEHYPTEISAYKTAYDLYTNNMSGGVADPNYPKPDVIIKKLSDYYTTDAARKQYLCETVFSDGVNISLVDVQKREYEADGVTPKKWESVYVAKLDVRPVEGTQDIAGEIYQVDSNGFLCSAFDVVVGVGKGAFKDVGNVKTLVLPAEVSFIGDSAFEGSFLQSINLPQDTKIGNRAFYGSILSNCEISDGIRRIGAEAFYGCPLTSVNIPDTCTYIGPGAFANSATLSSISFSDGGTNPKEIGKYAFYNDLNLSTVDFKTARIESIGEAAFAVNAIETDKMTAFTFPSYLGTDSSDNTNVGPYCLAGRRGLVDVTIPDNTKGKLNDTIFYMCSGLGSVTFGEQCYDMTFNSTEDQDGSPASRNTMFYTVTNPNFYVRGPKLNAGGTASNPRMSTWSALYDYAATGNVGRHVPYVYKDTDGKDYYEISDGRYLMVVDKETGTLISCTFPTGVTASPIDNFVIPANVGNTPITALADGCFDDDMPTVGVLDYIVNLTIEDGSNISSIDDNTFKGADRLETVDIGNSVSSIGTSAFEDCPQLTEVTIGENISSIGSAAFQNCPKLEDITFDIPYDYSVFAEGNIGENAFNTKGDKLTVHGEIVVGYAPFEWATDKENYANKNKSIRPLYKTHMPTGLSVILDNGNELVTLVDYPHYEYLDRVMYDATEDKLVELDTAPSAGDPNYINTVMYKIDNGEPLNNLEETMQKNCLKITIPAGVESIDAYGFFNDCSNNINNVDPYSNSASATAYYGTRSTLPYSSYNNIGLFNGYYGNEVGSDGKMRELPDGNPAEKEAKGNDRITSVSMADVVYLPDNAFDNCENLMTVSLGSGIKEMGELPFSACDSLSSIACGNDNFICNNGILYENNSDGTKTIVECLESRGNIVGRNTISVANDPDLADVKAIEKRAFKDCEGIYSVDLTGVNKLTTIPEESFIGCTNMTEIDIPSNVNRIGEQAFADTGNYTKVIVRNKNLYLEADTNGVPGDKVDTSYYVTYKDALSREMAEDQDYIIDQTLDDVWVVKYYDRTGTELLGTELVTDGKNAEGLDDDKIPVIEGMVFDGWNQSLKNITSDCFRIATYKSKDGSNNSDNPNVTPGTTPGTNAGTTPGTNPGTTPGANGSNGNTNNGGSGSDSGSTKYNLTVNYGSGSGAYAAGTTIIIEAIDAPTGKVFDKWTTSGSSTPTIASATSKATTLKMPSGDCIVTATYKDASSKVSTGTSSRNESGSTGAGTNSTRVDITKPGISNTDKAYASVSGTSDNFIVKITESAEAANLVATALANKYGDMTPIKYFAMDISLYDATGTTKITNTNGVKVNVTMPIPDAMTQYAGNNRVGAVNGTTLEDLNCKFVTVDGIPCVSFTATHFSPYTIYVDTNNLTYGTVDSSPKTGDGIHPKWFASIGLFCVSMVMFFKRDKVSKKRTKTA